MTERAAAVVCAEEGVKLKVRCAGDNEREVNSSMRFDMRCWAVVSCQSSVSALVVLKLHLKGITHSPTLTQQPNAVQSNNTTHINSHYSSR